MRATQTVSLVLVTEELLKEKDENGLEEGEVVRERNGGLIEGRNGDRRESRKV